MATIEVKRADAVNTIEINIEDYNEYIRLKDRVRQVEKYINREKYISQETLADILDIKIPTKESED